MPKILFASTNTHKVAEVVAVLAEHSISVLSLQEVAGESIPDVEETGSSFQENALLKAQTYANLYHMPTVADDSGLVVTALNGEPGVHSNRWYPGTNEERTAALLKRLEGVSDRSAAFVTVACLYNPTTQETKCSTGELTGTIALEPSGSDGFGYDPVFIPDGYSETLATLGQETKNAISHRARAFSAVAAYLTTASL